MVVHVTDDSFKKDVLDSKLPVIVDFWAEWCGPCRMLGPVFEDLSKDYEGKVKFAKANADECQTSAGQFQVMGIPCMILFKDGKEAGRIVGFRQKAKLKEEIDKVFS